MKEKILIVDDDPEMLNLLNIVVRENTSYEPVITNIPFEAVELVGKRDIDLVITKLKMQGLDGIQVLHETKTVDKEIPVIIISRYCTFELATEMMNNGGFDMIEIPFKKEQLLLAINKGMNWRKLHKDYRKLKERFKDGQPRTSTAFGVI